MITVDTEALAIEDAAYWANLNRIKLQKGYWSFDDHPYLEEIMQWPLLRRMRKAPHRLCAMKGTQGGWPLDISTPIPTPDGWVSMEDIQVGQKVFGTDGKIYTVLDVKDILWGRNCYKVVFSDLSEIVCDESHLWTVTDEWSYKCIEQATLTTKEIYESDKKGKRNRYVIPVAAFLDLPERQLPIHPYVLGLWLGDGNSYSTQITVHVDDAKEYSKTLTELGIDHELRNIEKRERFKNNRNIKINKSHGIFNAAGLIGNKHIPSEYLRASYNQRMDLLQGLMDTDGHITKDGKAEFYNINLTLIEQVKELILTLGFKAKLIEKGYSTNWDYTRSNGKMIYRIVFRPYNNTPITKLKRKAERQRDIDGSRTSETNRRRIIDVVPVESVPVRCIGVDSPNHLFLAGKDFIPTHNTEAFVNQTLHGQIHGHYPRGVLYLFPTNDEVREFSKSRFGPLISANPTAIGQFVQDTDTANLKSINGSMLYLRGARLSIQLEAGNRESSKLRGIPVDRVNFDELDMMDFDDVLIKAEQRMGASTVKEICFLSNPTLPDRGIAYLFERSDQRYWFRHCGCGEWTCAEEHFPDLVGKDKDGKGYIACKKCGKPTDFREGQWVPKERSKSDYMWGYHWSQLSSATNDPLDILHDYNDPPNGNLGDIIRLRLGKPFVSAEDKLTIAQVLACCGNRLQADSHLGPCAMGIDVRTHKNIIVGYRSGRDHYTIVRVARLPGVEAWGEALRMGQRFNVKSCVVDIGPDMDAARAFQQKAPFKVWLCRYSENTPVGNMYHDKTGIVVTNRTEICEKTHRWIADEKTLELPSDCPEIRQFARECCNIAKVEQIDKKNHQVIYRYVKLSGDHPDDYRHALNYFCLAVDSGHLPIVGDSGRRARQAHAISEYSMF